MIALVLGGAAELDDDCAAACTLLAEGAPVRVIAVNRAGLVHPCHHWASLHPELFWRDRGGPGWLMQRSPDVAIRAMEMGYTPRTALHPMLWGPSTKTARGVLSIPCTEAGSSGYFGVEVAKYLGADRIVLCGIPMTPTPHMDSDEPWEMANAHWKHWLREYAKGRLHAVRSMSGRTRRLLGAPTATWLRGPAVTTHASEAR